MSAQTACTESATEEKAPVTEERKRPRLPSRCRADTCDEQLSDGCRARVAPSPASRPLSSHSLVCLQWSWSAWVEQEASSMLRPQFDVLQQLWRQKPSLLTAQPTLKLKCYTKVYTRLGTVLAFWKACSLRLFQEKDCSLRLSCRLFR